MQSILKTLTPPVVISFFLILPLMIMEVVNRRAYNEGFPFFLFFVMWFSLLAISIILLPLAQVKWKRDPDTASLLPLRANSLLTNPMPAAVISVMLLLIVAIISWLQSLGWQPVETLINGPDPGQVYLPGMFISLALFAIPIVAGVIAAGVVAKDLRAGRSLLAHPVHLIIVAFLVAAFAFGLTSLIIDQWPCFIGVPICD